MNIINTQFSTPSGSTSCRSIATKLLILSIFVAGIATSAFFIDNPIAKIAVPSTIGFIGTVGYIANRCFQKNLIQRNRSEVELPSDHNPLLTRLIPTSTTATLPLNDSLAEETPIMDVPAIPAPAPSASSTPPPPIALPAAPSLRRIPTVRSDLSFVIPSQVQLATAAPQSSPIEAEGSATLAPIASDEQFPEATDTAAHIDTGFDSDEESPFIVVPNRSTPAISPERTVATAEASPLGSPEGSPTTVTSAHRGLSPEGSFTIGELPADGGGRIVPPGTIISTRATELAPETRMYAVYSSTMRLCRNPPTARNEAEREEFRRRYPTYPQFVVIENKAVDPCVEFVFTQGDFKKPDLPHFYSPTSHHAHTVRCEVLEFTGDRSHIQTAYRSDAFRRSVMTDWLYTEPGLWNNVCEFDLICYLSPKSRECIIAEAIERSLTRGGGARR